MPSITTNGVTNYNIRDRIGHERSEYKLQLTNSVISLTNKLSDELLPTTKLGEAARLAMIVVAFVAGAIALVGDIFIMTPLRAIFNGVVLLNKRTAAELKAKMIAQQTKQETTVSTEQEQTATSTPSTSSTVNNSINESQVVANKNSDINFVEMNVDSNSEIILSNNSQTAAQTATNTQTAASTVLPNSLTITIDLQKNIFEIANPNAKIEEAAKVVANEEGVARCQEECNAIGNAFEGAKQIAEELSLKQQAARAEAAEKKAARDAARQHSHTLINGVCIAGIATLAGITLYQNADLLRAQLSTATDFVAANLPSPNRVYDFVSTSMPEKITLPTSLEAARQAGAYVFRNIADMTSNIINQATTQTIRSNLTDVIPNSTPINF